jgi:hypothetical protein
MALSVLKEAGGKGEEKRIGGMQRERERERERWVRFSVRACISLDMTGRERAHARACP